MRVTFLASGRNQLETRRRHCIAWWSLGFDRKNRESDSRCPCVRPRHEWKCTRRWRSRPLVAVSIREAAIVVNAVGVGDHA